MVVIPPFCTVRKTMTKLLFAKYCFYIHGQIWLYHKRIAYVVASSGGFVN